MSRPANPSYTVPTWATNANHAAAPGKPWSNQPTKVVHPSPAAGFVPEQGAAAEYVNDLLNKAFNTDGSAKTKLTEILDYAGQFAALNPLVPVSSIGTIYSVGYDPATRTWWLVGASANVRASTDQGRSWAAGVTITGAAGENARFIDFDAAGKAVVTTTTRYVFEFDGSVWTRRDVFGGALTAIGAIAFAPGPNLWCWIADGTIKTSADRTTWTSRTPPTGWAAGFADEGPNLFRIACKRSTGRLVAIGVDGTTCRPGYSTDGGVTWTTPATFTTTIAAAEETHLIYNPVTNTWIYTIGVGAGACEVWRSADDGATWTKVCTLATQELLAPAPVGNLLVASAYPAHELVYSVDDGATWKRPGFVLAFSSGTRGAWAGDGCVMVATDNRVYPPFRTGLVGSAVT